MIEVEQRTPLQVFEGWKLRGRLLGFRSQAIKNLAYSRRVNDEYGIYAAEAQLAVVNEILRYAFHVEFPEYDSPMVTMRKDLRYEYQNGLEMPQEVRGKYLQKFWAARNEAVSDE